jgi:hypothetical protein
MLLSFGMSRENSRLAAVSSLAPLRHADEHEECLLIGGRPEGPADGGSDAIDPRRKSRSFSSPLFRQTLRRHVGRQGDPGVA